MSDTHSGHSAQPLGGPPPTSEEALDVELWRYRDDRWPAGKWEYSDTDPGLRTSAMVTVEGPFRINATGQSGARVEIDAAFLSGYARCLTDTGADAYPEYRHARDVALAEFQRAREEPTSP